MTCPLVDISPPLFKFRRSDYNEVSEVSIPAAVWLIMEHRGGRET